MGYLINKFRTIGFNCILAPQHNLEGWSPKCSSSYPGRTQTSTSRYENRIPSKAQWNILKWLGNNETRCVANSGILWSIVTTAPKNLPSPSVASGTLPKVMGTRAALDSASPNWMVRYITSFHVIRGWGTVGKGWPNIPTFSTVVTSSNVSSWSCTYSAVPVGYFLATGHIATAFTVTATGAVFSAVAPVLATGAGPALAARFVGEHFDPLSSKKTKDLATASGADMAYTGIIWKEVPKMVTDTRKIMLTAQCKQ